MSISKPAIRDLIKQAEALQVAIEALADDAQSEWDDRSERWQDGDNGAAAQEQIDTVVAAADSITDAVASLEEAL